MLNDDNSNNNRAAAEAAVVPTATAAATTTTTLQVPDLSTRWNTRMSLPPIWILSIPFGFVNLFYPRVLALFLMEKSGLKLDNANPRHQVEGKEVAMKDTDG